MEQRKERARIRAMQEEILSQSNLQEMPLEAMQQDQKLAKMFNTYHGRLEKINEEVLYTENHKRKPTEVLTSERVNTESNQVNDQIQNDKMMTVE